MTKQKKDKSHAVQAKAPTGEMTAQRSKAPRQFSLDASGGNKQGGTVQRQQATTAQAAPQQTTPVIETTRQAWGHYMNGGGTPVDIGPNTITSLLALEDFQRRHRRITGGLTSSLTGNFSVDMTGTVFHVGRTNIDYEVIVNGDKCTVNYTLFVNDGFWDVDFIDETILGGLGSPRHQADGMGPNLERFGGQPYRYNTARRSFTFDNPGY